MAVLACLLCLKKVHKKIYSKEYCLMEQSLYELETEEAEVAKTGSIPTVVETTDILGVESPVFKAYQLSLTNPFVFNLFFFNCLTYFFIIFFNFFLQCF